MCRKEAAQTVTRSVFDMKFSLVIPVYNRPNEVAELLESLTKQTDSDFEVIIVEDGSTMPCHEVVERYIGCLDIHCFAIPHSGQGQSRNYGAERAQGEYLIILDSDIIVPETYVANVRQFLEKRPVDAFGGPDCAHASFSNIQKAINYAMTSFFTTGGIRGGKKKLDKFFPRSFNMGVRREVYQQLGGFRAMRFGEDIDFSYRIVEAGYTTVLIDSAFVYHKRRTDLRKFFRQVYNSGNARVNLTILHPGTLKPVHLLPAAFTVGVVALVLLGCVYRVCWYVLLLYMVMIGVDASIRNKSALIGTLAIAASFVQLMGYGSGFLVAAWRRQLSYQGGDGAARELCDEI